MVAKYDRFGVRFLYPDNWKVQEENPQPQTHCVTLQSPGSAFWMLQLMQTEESPERLSAEVLYSFKQDYDEVEVSRIEEEIHGTPSIGYDIQFYCLDFVVASQIRSFHLLDRACVLLIQAEDSEFEQMEPVFRAITASLFQEAKRDAN